MKILYICPSLGLYGDNIALLRIMPYLTKMGVDPLFMVVEGSEAERVFREKGYLTVSCPNMLHTLKPSGSLPNRIVSLLRRLKYYLKTKEYIAIGIERLGDFKPDIIHSNTAVAKYGYELANYMNIPHVWHIREYGKLDIGRGFFPTDWHFKKLLSSRNNYCITITKQLSRYFDLNEGKNIVIYDGPISLDRVLPEIKNKEKYFLFVGRLVRTKNVHLTIIAFAQFVKYYPEYVLEIVGDSDDIAYKKELIDLVHKLNLLGYVKFEGYQNNVSKWMESATALIVPSRFEAFGFITAEAMYYGCPVLGMNTGGTAEQIVNVSHIMLHEGNYLFNNAVELYDRMCELINSYPSVEQLAKIQNYVRLLYNAQGSAKQVFNVYKKIIA